MKKVLFSFFSVILLMEYVFADDISNLTLDTPVNWPVSAFNRAVVRFCEAGQYRAGFRSVDDEIIGAYETNILKDTYEIDGEYVDVRVTRDVSDFERNCGQFVLKYTIAYKQNNKISLRSIIDMCTESVDSFVCGNIAKAIVAYSLNQDASKSLEPKIEGVIENTQRWYSEDGKFYVDVNMSFVKDENRVEPGIKDVGIYLSETGRPVGVCGDGYTLENDDGIGFLPCTMANDFVWYHCSVLTDYRQKLDCEDKFIIYQKSVINNNEMYLDKIKKDLASLDNGEFFVGYNKITNRKQKECYKREFQKEADRIESFLNAFGPVIYVHSIERWQETIKNLNTISTFSYILNAREICGSL